MTTFYDTFMDFPPPERKQIAERAGLSIGYILKQTYVRGRDPKFRLHNAVALDRASDGVIPFHKHTEGGIDWGYVLERLTQAKEKGELA